MLAPNADNKAPPRSSFRRFVRRWAIILGGTYLLFVALMWFFENKLVYFPLTAAQEWQEAPPGIRDVNFASQDGTTLHGRWLPYRDDAPVLILCKGNGGNISYRGETMLKMRQQLGVNVFTFDYPGYGKSAGKPNEPRCYAAAEGAIAWLREQHGVTPERLIFYGESLGGGVATEMAVRYPNCFALVLVKTFTLLPAAAKHRYPFLPTYWLMTNRYDNVAKLPQLTCPIMVLNAVHDEVVPFAHGEELYAKAPGKKHFFRMEQGGHNDSVPDTFWPELRTFLNLREAP